MSNLDRVREFHEAYGCTLDAEDSPSLRKIRAELILEEAVEVVGALLGVEAACEMVDRARWRILGSGGPDPQSLEAVAKELGDLSMVKDGTALALRIDMEEAERRVHAANMTKTRQHTPAGQTKVLKGPDYRPPDMDGVVGLLNCPRCGSPDPAKHPAVQFEGEVQICPHSWHGGILRTETDHG